MLSSLNVFVGTPIKLKEDRIKSGIASGGQIIHSISCIE